jgi:hypothetical protein
VNRFHKLLGDGQTGTNPQVLLDALVLIDQITDGQLGSSPETGWEVLGYQEVDQEKPCGL